MRDLPWLAAGLAITLVVGLVAGWRTLATQPEERAGDTLVLAGLQRPVDVARRPDGLWRIAAANEHDAMFAVGWLQARDRTAQLDILRHVARGEMAALVGDRPFGEGTALDLDVRNRFLGFVDEARWLWERVSGAERRALGAYVAGVNAWLRTSPLPPEHRLLGVDRIRPWRPEDSLAIYRMLMFTLSSNADREVRRLALACAVGLEAAERVWPTDVVFRPAALPGTDLLPARFPVPDAVVPELAAELSERCREGGVAPDGRMARQPSPEPLASAEPLALLGTTWSASNNWAVDGTRSASGRPILSNDPQLPHMNPPLVWGVEVSYGDHHVAGFTMAGMHRVVFGHNGQVAWGATTNHVDRQDLVVHRRRRRRLGDRVVEGYELDGRFVPFERRTETFAVRGADPVPITVRFTRDGPLVNDIDPAARGRIPLTALRRVPPGRGGDLDAARGMTHARTAAELAAALDGLDAGCQSWVFADAEGSIGYRSPCLVPVRPGWRGTFPIPGWTRRYDWRGFVPKRALPASDDPPRGWLATANAQIVPPARFPTTYNADTAASNRFVRIGSMLRGRRALSARESARMQLDRREPRWPRLRRALGPGVCDAELPAALGPARDRLCRWKGVYGPRSAAATVFVLWTNAVLDRALADEIPAGAASPLWHWVLSLHQFEADVQRLLLRDEDDPVWDDVGTPERESRSDVMRAAFEDAVGEARRRWGGDPDDWRWGAVRPFVLRHLFSTGGGPLGWWLDSGPYAIGGGPETVFKNQFSRADRTELRPLIGPVVRFTVDFGDPWAATYTLAGGESGWPSSGFYGSLMDDWAVGRGRPLTPAPSDADVTMRLVPRARRATGSAHAAGSHHTGEVSARSWIVRG